MIANPLEEKQHPPKMLCRHCTYYILLKKMFYRQHAWSFLIEALSSQNENLMTCVCRDLDFGHHTSDDMF